MGRRTTRTDTQRVSIQPPSLTFKPRHPQQTEALRVCRDNSVVLLCGPAGVAKTFIATWYAISSALEGEFQKIYISRPAVTSGADIGYLPGSAEMKMSSFLAPIHDARDKIGKQGLDQVKSFFEVLPMCYIRGRTIEQAILVVDEAQNLTPDEIFTIVTRVGEGGKIILCGDTMQNDLRDGRSVLDDAADTCNGARIQGYSAGCYRFTEEANVRHPLNNELTRRILEADWYRDRNKRR